MTTRDSDFTEMDAALGEIRSPFTAVLTTVNGGLWFFGVYVLFTQSASTGLVIIAATVGFSFAWPKYVGKHRRKKLLAGID